MASITVKFGTDGSLTAFRNRQVWTCFAATSSTSFGVKLGPGDIALQLPSADRGKSTQLA
ncbi:hypothetical protein [Lichenicola sp.]|uniref:hypothetical protein n=1 Tax=Lichenicola sp. TaxID=2804529 RepID=UPI003AFFB6F8